MIDGRSLSSIRAGYAQGFGVSEEKKLTFVTRLDGIWQRNAERRDIFNLIRRPIILFATNAIFHRLFFHFAHDVSHDQREVRTFLMQICISGVYNIQINQLKLTAGYRWQRLRILFRLINGGCHRRKGSF